MMQTDGPTRGLATKIVKDAGRELAQTLMVRTLEGTTGKIQGLTQRLTDAVGGDGADQQEQGDGQAAGGSGGGSGGGGGEGKLINIVEEFDVGLPLRVVYDQWTQFGDYPSFTRKVESVEQESDEKVNWRAKIFLSHRSWESTIIEQVPDERIIWSSKGSKGYVDGVVTFHEITPTMTRVMLVAEYHPDGFLEKTANLWRAQGRRLRLDFKHIKRHMMTHTLLEQDEVEGWRGEIRDGEVVKTHEEALEEEQQGEQEEEREETREEERDGEREEAKEHAGQSG